MPVTFSNPRKTCFFTIAFIVLLLAITSLGFTPSVSAQEPDTEIRVFEVSQQDLNGDGKPDQTIIDCAFITERDRVLVYDRGEDMKPAETWEEATDFQNDLWVFDAAADDHIELIIDFRKRGRILEAWLWDDQDGDGTVSYQPPPDLTVTENSGPTIKVIAPGGWWTRDGKTNFNLDLVVDGKVQTSFSSTPWLRLLNTDGSVDFSLQVRDTDEDGRPDYQWVNVWPRARASLDVRRTEITFNPSDDEPPIKGSIFWPFLGSTLDWNKQRQDRAPRLSADLLHIRQERSGYNKQYNISMPPIQMLWDRGLLLYVGEFVASRFNDDTWFVYSIARALPDEVSPVNFEAPFAFYDLAADNDGYPELAIRFEQYLERDLFPFRGKNPEPVQIIRYSWDQDNNTAWDYKIGLIGRHPITDTVAVGDLTLLMIPPSILPQWTVNRAWDGATFVATEDHERWTSEGIYEWGPDNSWRGEYVTGISSKRPSVNGLGDLEIGQRGEYVFDLHQQPQLYMSPVDHKLHLLGAEGGQWKIDDAREIHYANLGGDYLNQWTLFENGLVVQELYFLSGYVIYEDQTGLQLTRTDQRPTLFTAAPPTNNQERLVLDQELQHYQHDLNAWDFEALALQFGSPQWQVEAASIKDLRLTDEGFRFVIELQPGFRATGTELNLSALEPGTYLVRYDGAFHVEPLTALDLSLSVRLPQTANPSVGEPVSVLVEAANNGLADANDLMLVVWARKQKVRVEIMRQRVDVLSGVPMQFMLNWKPLGEGEWDLEAWLGYPNGKAIVTDAFRVVDVTRETATPHRILELSAGSGLRLLPVTITLLALLTVTISMMRSALNAEDKRSVDQESG